MLKSGKISLKDLKGTSRLFADFLYDFPRVKDFYCADFRDFSSYQAIARQLAQHHYERQNLAEILDAQARAFGFGQKTFDNLSRLQNSQSVTVITGQQVGLLCGPLYTIYKALTVLKLAEQLSRRLGIAVLPIFWMAADDHDFEEICRIGLIDKANRFVRIRYQAAGQPANLPMSAFTLRMEINDFIDQIMAALPETEFRLQTENLMRTAYRPGMSVAEAFGRMMGELFRDSGLIVVNPADASLKRMAKPVFRQEIESFPETNRIVRQANLDLEARGYHVQVTHFPAYPNLFLAPQTRARLGFDGEMFFADSLGEKFARSKLLARLESAPEQFSPSVLLRPIVQDHIFPTLAYVGGPAEISYFAQIAGLHRHFGLPCPIVFPRIFATLVDKQASRTMEKYNLDLQDMMDNAGLQAHIRELVEKLIPSNLADKFDRDRHKILTMIHEIEGHLTDLDEGIRMTVQKTKGKVEYELRSLQDKILKAFKKKHEHMVSAIISSAEMIFPEFELQERHLNIIGFVNKYGIGFVDKLNEHLKLDAFDQQVIRLEELGY